MEPDRPFKHVEVIDARTGVSCKVACMACIRGHRATSCGGSSCRQKVFWTVKRPGRPSNSCSCRYRVGGTCKCNLVQSTCPHRVKGAKRSTDCRCQEQGRYCCYLDASQWEEMHALRKPRVTLFSSREDLDSAHAKSGGVSVVSPTPSLAASAHQTLSSIPSTPESTRMSNVSIANMDLEPPRNGSDGSKALRFSMMGVGGPWGNDTTTPQDALQWQGLAPEMPAEYTFNQSSQMGNAVRSDPSSHHLQAMASPSYPYASHLDQQGQTEFMPPITNALQEMHMAPSEIMPPESTFDIDKLMTDYVHYQFPSAICQKCGLNGCTCRNCPPVMQNADNGSWGHGCSRKHTMTARSTVAASASTTRRTTAEAAPRSGCCSGDASRRPQQPQPQPQSNQLYQAQGSQNGGIEQDSNFPLTLHDPSFSSSDFHMDDFELHSNHDPQLVELQEQSGGSSCCAREPSTPHDLSDILLDQLHNGDSQFRYEPPDSNRGAGCCGG